jgi:hypothetical protein
MATKCKLCNRPTELGDSELCNGCWELDKRIRANPAVALRIIREVLPELTPGNYTSLNDVVNRNPKLATVLGQGETQVWYKRERAGSLTDPKPDPNDLLATHILLGEVCGTDPEELFFALQGEIWSPHGEAADLIRINGLHHTSMSVGDVLAIDGRVLYCAGTGWEELAPGDEPDVDDTPYVFCPRCGDPVPPDNIGCTCCPS